LKLRFSTAISIFGAPKKIIKRTTTQTLSEILQTKYFIPPYFLIYEMLDVSIMELETKKFLSIAWLGSTIKVKVSILTFGYYLFASVFIYVFFLILLIVHYKNNRKL
jgi:hypothetical protein